MRTLDSWVEGGGLSESKLEEIASLLRELLKWSKFGGKQQLKAVLIDNLGEDTEKIVYEYTDGERSVREIGKFVGVGKTLVSRYWQKWFKLGIVEKSPRFEGRMQHIFSLEEVGLEVPLSPQAKTKSVTISEESEPAK